ncbi:F-box domain-containing protein [Colletotrichum falcatum]|nr:F-box domain-containing protein [Colletotrichum falcatum]
MCGPASSAPDRAGPPSRFSASLFAKLPAELKLEILSHCRRNDLVCISLSSHYLRDLVLPLIPEKPRLELHDQNLAPEDVSCGGGGGGGSSSCREHPPDHPVCRRRGCAHCMCVSCPLHARLGGWMGEGLRYCSKCRKFTRREWTKKYNGRCLHGRPKVRRTSNNRWTATKGRSYGDRWWNGWGTRGVDRWGFDGERHLGGDNSSLAGRRNARVV